MKPNLILDELIFVAKKHLSLIILVLICSGLFYFLIPYVAQELGYTDITETPYTGFMTLSSGVKMEAADYNRMAAKTRSSFLALSAAEQQRVISELNEAKQKIVEAGASWIPGITELSLLSKEQRIQILNGVEIPAQGEIDQLLKSQPLPPPLTMTGSLPDSWDWRNARGYDYITSVKNQNMPFSCGSCWAFGIIGSLEAAFQIYYDWPNTIPEYAEIDLSEQDLVSCWTTLGCSGVNYRDLKDLVSFYILNDGVPSEECFPYQAQDSRNGIGCDSVCRYRNYNYYKAKSYYLPFYFNDIRKYLVDKGPMATPVYVDEYFDKYTSGIYEAIGNNMYGHVMTLIGYDQSPQGFYWIYKNSYGFTWGEDGFVRMRGYQGKNFLNYLPITPISMLKGDVYPAADKHGNSDVCGDGVVTLEDLYAMARGIVTAGDSFNDCQKKKADLPTGSPCRPPDGEIDVFDMSTLEDKYLGRPNCIDGW